MAIKEKKRSSGSSTILKGLFLLPQKSLVMPHRVQECAECSHSRCLSPVCQTQLWLVLKSLSDVRNIVDQIQKWCLLPCSSFSLSSQLLQQEQCLGSWILPQSHVSHRERVPAGSAAASSQVWSQTSCKNVLLGWKGISLQVHMSREAQPAGMTRTVQLKKEPWLTAVFCSCADEGSLLSHVPVSRSV